MDRHPHRRMIVNMKPKSEFESVLPGGSSLLRTIDVYKSNPKFHRNGDRHLNFQNQVINHEYERDAASSCCRYSSILHSYCIT